MTQIFDIRDNDVCAEQMLQIDMLIHQFIDRHKRAKFIGTEDEYTTVYSPKPHQYEIIEGDSFYRRPLQEGESWKFHGADFRAYSYHSPEGVQMMKEADDDGWSFGEFNMNEDGIPFWACSPVPSYHRTGEQIQAIHDIMAERGLEVKYNINFQHPRVEIQITIGDHSADAIVLGDELSPSILLNVATALATVNVITAIPN